MTYTLIVSKEGRLSYLRRSRARQTYTCAGCGRPILVGTVYFRDEPHPMARYHRGVMVRHLCGQCVPIARQDDFKASADVKFGQLAFDFSVLDLPNILVQTAIIHTGANVDDGQIVIGVAIPWFEIILEINRNPSALFEVPWRRLEELIAGAYQRAGWEVVVLTPRSRDRGRDIIAEKRGVGAIRIVDQVKAYSADRRVTADDVRGLLGVLTAEPNISKGIITTTAEFAPGIKNDAALRRFMPYRLEMRSGPELRAWLVSVLHNSP